LSLAAARDTNGAAGALGLGKSLRSTMNKQVIEGRAHVQEQAATPGTDAPRFLALSDLRGSLR